jgi:hypothetical protein
MKPKAGFDKERDLKNRRSFSLCANFLDPRSRLSRFRSSRLLSESVACKSFPQSQEPPLLSIRSVLAATASGARSLYHRV